MLMRRSGPCRIVLAVAVCGLGAGIACGSSKAKRKLAATGGSAGAGAMAGAGATSGSGGISGGAAGSGGTAGQAGVGGGAGADAGPGDAGPPKCPTGMVFGPKDKYCIDSTEVPRQAYENWLKTNPSTASQGKECDFNKDFAPTSTGECANLQFFDPFVPQTCVDWCDAQAYCKSTGKRLCGQIGGPAGVLWSNAFDALFSQWFAACTKDGTRNHPYGTFQAGKCQRPGWQWPAGESSVQGQCMSRWRPWFVRHERQCAGMDRFLFQRSVLHRWWELQVVDGGPTGLQRLGLQ